MRNNKLLLLWSSLGVLALLLVAAFQENVLREWRTVQAAVRSDAGPLEVRLRQVVVPTLKVADRCVSCHVGMAPGEQGLRGHVLAAAHPAVGHDPAEFGCTTCHAGQGRATDRADAHGEVHFWPSPMIPRRHAQAGCGGCHTHLKVPALSQLRAGHAALERADCLACHKLDGRGGLLRPGGGGMEGPDLSRIGMSGYGRDWYAGHLARRQIEGGAWHDSFGPLPPVELEAIGVLLDTRVGAPALIEAKALFHSLGCRGCHKVDGVGGDDGPDLTREGEKDPGRADFTHVPGERRLDAWFAEHFRAPGKIVPGSAMPALGLSEEQIGQLNLYMFSLRRPPVPEALWPRDRLRVLRFGEREFATDGETLYGSFCAACHGPRGEGMRFAGLPAFPAIASPDFLAVASDEFLRATVVHGRPGRRMPAWGEKEGGLRPAEVDAVVAYVRQAAGVQLEPDPRPRLWAKGDAAEGERLYAAACASCHGPKGQGGEGPALRNRVLLEAASDTYLFETIRRGRRGTSMLGFATATPVRPALADADVESIVSYLRTTQEGS